MGIPKPFSRPSISLSEGTKKDWIETEVKNLHASDIVQGWGSVSQITTDLEMTVIVWSNGRISTFDPSDVVTAFTAVV